MPYSLFFLFGPGSPEHESSDQINTDLIGKGPEGPVSFHQFFPDRDVLGTVLFTLAALYALAGKGRFSGKAHGLGELEAALAL